MHVQCHVLYIVYMVCNVHSCRPTATVHEYLAATSHHPVQYHLCVTFTLRQVPYYSFVYDIDSQTGAIILFLRNFWCSYTLSLQSMHHSNGDKLVMISVSVRPDLLSPTRSIIICSWACVHYGMCCSCVSVWL